MKKLPLPKIFYYINITKELEINSINKSSKYLSIDKELLLENIIENLIYIYITKFNNWKGLLPKNYFNITAITKDGNFLFQVISKYLLGKEIHHLYFKKYIIT